MKDALAIDREYGVEEYVAGDLNSLGELERERKNYDAAERYCREALEIGTKRDDKHGIACFSGNLGALALDSEQWAEAHKWFEQAMPLAKEVARQDLIADVQYGLARVHEAEGHVDLALPLAQEALKIFERLQHRNLAAAREFVERLQKAESSRQ